MESITNQLEQAGYKLVNTTNIHELIKEILAHGNQREKLAIPTLIRKHNIDLELIPKNILEITRKLFEEFNIQKTLPKQDIPIDKQLYQRYKQDFELQLHAENTLTPQQARYERKQQHALNQLFSKKEQEILQNIQHEQPVSKTEYEYFSRKTKKKLQAITTLQTFAETLQHANPQKKN